MTIGVITKLAKIADSLLKLNTSAGAGQIGSLIGVDLATAKISVPNYAAITALPPPAVPAGRTLLVYMAGFTTAGDGGEGDFFWEGNSNETPVTGMIVTPIGHVGPGRWKRSYSEYIHPEFFGAVGNFDWGSQQGTVNTVALQAALCWCNRKGSILRPKAGAKYLTDTLYLHYDLALNPNWPGRAGRVSIWGHGNGHATGALEDPGTAFVHINGSANPLLSLKGVFDIASPTGMGGYFSLLNFNLVGGTSTTKVLHLQGSQGSIKLENYTVKVQNPAGTGIEESTTWETTHVNGLIRGGATGDGSWTGVGLHIRSDGTQGQTNMKTYINVDCYKMGYGTRIGRGDTAVGTMGPLTFIGGQTSNSDQHGLWLEGGVIAFTSIGYQHEGARKNAIRIDRTLEDGVTLSTDLPRSVKIINTYITGCGLVDNGTADSYAVYVANGDGIELDGLVLNNAGDGIGFDAGNVDNLLIRRPTWRTVRAYGAASGTGIKAFGTQDASKRIYVEHPTFNQNPLLQVDSVANQVIARGRAGGRLSFATNATTVSISLGGAAASEPVRQLNFNYSAPTTVTNITGGQMFQELTLTFSNTNVTIPNNRSTFFLSGAAFTPGDSKSILRLFFDGTAWNEISRSQNT